MTLEPIQIFEVPTVIVKASDEALQKAGRDGYELFVLWTGSIHGTSFQVEHSYVPNQRSFRGDEGLHVRVEAPDLHRLNQWLYQHSQVLAIQIHTHPKAAYHSDTDNSFPIVTTVGGLSIVVPNFGRDGIGCPGTAVFRLLGGRWQEIDVRAQHGLLQVVD